MLPGFFSRPFDGLLSVFALWRLLDRRAWGLFLFYFGLAATAVLAFVGILKSAGPEVRQALLAYVLPEHWIWAGRMLFDRLFHWLGAGVLSNFVLNGSMAAISVLCFVPKELLSRRIEHHNPLLSFGHDAWPLWRQALEELKFGLLYLLAYDVIFWLGYPPWGINRTIAQVLSYFALYVFFNITFLCPLFLRHRIGYGRMIRTFLARPLPSFSFAALFTAPSLVAGHLLRGDVPLLAAGAMVGCHVLLAAPAAVAGTWLAARLLPVARDMKPARWPARLVGWGGMLGLLLASGLVFANLTHSIDKKSQILKCGYDVDWSSASLKPPSLSDLSVGLSLDVRISNPNPVEVHIEPSRLEVTNAGKPFATARLREIQVPAGESRTQRIDLNARISLGRLLDYKELWSEDWDFVLWIEVRPGWEFPVYFR